MKTGKRIAAVILSVVLILTSFPVTVLAAESGDFTYEVYDGKAEITGYTGSASELVISDTLNGYPVESIGYEAFRDCDHLTTVTIPDSVESIGGYAFYYCTSLTTVEIPDSVESIGNSAFDNCDSLESIQVDENNPNYSSDASGVLFDKNKTTLLQYPIGNARTSYTIPDSVESIGDKAFYHCDMTTVEIGDSVTSIGKQAFAECDSLTTVTIPDSVTSIGDYAFRYCDSLKSIQVSENNPNYSSDASGVLFDKSKSTLIQYPIGNARTSYTLLDNVGSISEYAFAWCDSLTTVEIGDSVESIGRYAFSSCDSLTTVTIPDSVTSIGDDAFFSCDSLTTVEIGNSVNSIGEEAFVMCFGLTMVEIGNSVISIGSWAFSSCFSLTTVEIPGSVESIGEGAFRFCDSLKSIQVDENNPNYSSDASGVLFDKSQTTLIQYPIGNACTSYSIPESVESIGEYAFAPCNSLTTVEIGDSVESIGTRAFSGCGSLTTVYYAGTQEEWEQIAIESGNEDLLKAKLIFQYDPENPCVSGRHTEEVLPGKDHSSDLCFGGCGDGNLQPLR